MITKSHATSYKSLLAVDLDLRPRHVAPALLECKSLSIAPLPRNNVRHRSMRHISGQGRQQTSRWDTAGKREQALSSDTL